MASERVQRHIDRLLDEAEEAITQLDWQVVRDRAQAVLRLDPGNNDARAYLSAADRDRSGVGTSTPSEPVSPSSVPAISEHPSSFADDRYQVNDFLGEGGKKRVYRAHDSVLDRDVALAVINTEGLDPTSRVRITREAQAMGRLGDHPHILSIHDLGEDNGLDAAIRRAARCSHASMARPGI